MHSRSSRRASSIQRSIARSPSGPSPTSGSPTARPSGSSTRWGGVPRQWSGSDATRFPLEFPLDERREHRGSPTDRRLDRRWCPARSSVCTSRSTRSSGASSCTGSGSCCTGPSTLAAPALRRPPHRGPARRARARRPRHRRGAARRGPHADQPAAHAHARARGHGLLPRIPARRAVGPVRAEEGRPACPPRSRQAAPARPLGRRVLPPEPLARADPLVRALPRRRTRARRGRARPLAAALPHRRRGGRSGGPSRRSDPCGAATSARSAT